MSQRAVAVVDRSQIGEARRLAARLATEAGLQTVAAGRVAIVASELASNAVRHGGGGELLFQVIDQAFEILAIDRGLGMASLEACLADGYSTGGTSGTGLGAVLRQSDEFDAWSAPGQGTVVMSRIAEARQPPPTLAVGAICLPKAGEELCGDAWAVCQQSGEASLLVVDGLGHGALPAAAAAEALRAFGESPYAGPAQTIDSAHHRMSQTRGGVIAVAHLASDAERLRYAGVGNIGGQLLHPAGSRGLMSYNGTMGTGPCKTREIEVRWPEGGVLVMHSDGIGSRWQLERYPGLIQRHPAVIAAILYRDFKRGNDDVTTLVANRCPPRSAGRRSWS